MPDKINPVSRAIFIPEAINPVRAIRYARQNRTPTQQYPAIQVPDLQTKSYAHLAVTLRYQRYWFLKLGELLAIADKIVRPPSSNPAYPAIKVPEAINPERVISYAMQSRTPTLQ